MGREIGFFFLIPLAIGGIAFVVLGIYFVVQTVHQVDTLNTFCRYEVSKDYLDAAALFSPGYLGGTTPNQFAVLNVQRDDELGTIQSCSIAHDDFYLNFQFAEFTLQTKIGGKTYTGNVFLTTDGYEWQINSLDPSLHLDTP